MGLKRKVVPGRGNFFGGGRRTQCEQRISAPNPGISARVGFVSPGRELAANECGVQWVPSAQKPLQLRLDGGEDGLHTGLRRAGDDVGEDDADSLRGLEGDGFSVEGHEGADDGQLGIDHT